MPLFVQLYKLSTQDCFSFYLHSVTYMNTHAISIFDSLSQGLKDKTENGKCSTSLVANTTKQPNAE